jgi:hypothetical protein
MFNGQEQVKIRTDLPYAKVLDKVEEYLSELGEVYVDEEGDFTIDGQRFNTFGVEVKFDGWVEERKKGREYTIGVKYNMNPTTGGIILAVVLAMVFLPLVLIFVFLGMNAQSDIKRRLRDALNDLEDDLDR